jgi:hypothetical protein
MADNKIRRPPNCKPGFARSSFNSRGVLGYRPWSSIFSAAQEVIFDRMSDNGHMPKIVGQGFVIGPFENSFVISI